MRTKTTVFVLALIVSFACLMSYCEVTAGEQKPSANGRKTAKDLPNDAKELTNLILALVADNVQLKQTLKNLENLAKDLQSKNADLQDKSTHLELHQRTLAAQNEDLRRKNKDLETEIDALRKLVPPFPPDEFLAVIREVDARANKVIFSKPAKKGEPADPALFTLTVTMDAKIAKGQFNKDTKKVEAGDDIENGIKNALFTTIGEVGLRARITVADLKIVRILIYPSKKKE